MKHLTILLPFGLPPADTASALIREVRAPALATLLSRAAGGDSASERPVDPFARALAHENWLAQRFGLNASKTEGEQPDNSPAAATAAMAAYGLSHDPSGGHWFMLQPAHIHVARDHLVLTGLRQLALAEDDARALFDAIQPLFAETGKTLLYGSADTWFMRADEWSDLRTATPDAASGRNIDIWMPQGASGRAWRKLQNEIQMQWFTDPVNEKREAAGQKPVNALWLWGGAATGQDTSAPTSPTPLPSPAPIYNATFNLSGWMQLFGHSSRSGIDLPQADVARLLATAGESGLLLLDALVEPGLTNEWTYWLERLEQLEKEWFAPLLAALRGSHPAGSLASVHMVLTGQDRMTETTTTRAGLYKFWIKPTLRKLAA